MSVPSRTSVIPAFRDSGFLKVGTPLLTASMPVKAVHPDENARRSKSTTAIWLIGCVMLRPGAGWGAISKTNCIGLRWRDPVYRALRELAMSWFHEYYNRRDHKTLREYSRPFDLRRIDPAIWVSGEKNAWQVAEALEETPHYDLVTRTQAKRLTRRDAFERRIGNLQQYRKPRALARKATRRKG